MFRRKTLNSICIGLGVSVVLILAGKLLTDNIEYYPSFESRMNLRYFWRNFDDNGADISLQSLPINIYDGSPDMNKILYITRRQIKLQLKEYFLHLEGQQLDDLVMESNGHPIRNVIISTWGSGATFLGELLNAIPGTFYHHEPLLQYGNIQIRGPPQAQGALNVLRNMLMCEFQDLQEYFENSKKLVYQFHHNSRLWDHFCRFKNELCYDTEFTGKLCKLFPFQAMKVIHLRLRLIQDILKDNNLNVKAVLLIRDPRGVLQSRQHREFCLTAPDCWRPDLLCADMVSDYVAAGRLMKLFPGRLMVQRFEELALSSNATAQKLFKFFGMNTTPEVEEFLRLHTTIEVPGVSSTFKVSKNVPFKWKTVLDFKYVEQIQSLCSEAMSLWGYRMAHNASQMASQDFYPLEPYTINP